MENTNSNLMSKESECKGRAGLYGLSTGSIVFAGVYFCQTAFIKKRVNNIILSSLFASASAYLTIKNHNYSCERSSDATRLDALSKFKQ